MLFPLTDGGEAMKNKILSIGEIIWDVFPDKSVIGGAPLNFAAHCALCGAESALLSAVGEDQLGKDALAALKKFGVSDQYVKCASEPTGQCIVTLDQNAVPSYNVLRDVAYDNITVSGGDIEAINKEGYDALYFGTLIQRNSVSRDTVKTIVEKCSFEHIICDVNLRPDCFDASSVGLCLSSATVLKVSDEEEPTLRSLAEYRPLSNGAEDIAKALCERYKNLKTVIITKGKNGSFAYDALTDSVFEQPAIGGSVVSTVGAGDSFAAAWLVNYLQGKPINFCMEKAAERSGFVVSRVEAIPLD